MADFPSAALSSLTRLNRFHRRVIHILQPTPLYAPSYLRPPLPIPPAYPWKLQKQLITITDVTSNMFKGGTSARKGIGIEGGSEG